MVTDRTQSDIDAAKQMRLKLQAGQSLTEEQKAILERGTCTAVMLNRIENAQKSLAILLNKYAYMINISNKTWTTSQIFSYDACQRVLENLDRLKKAFYTYETTPDTPSYMYGRQEANDIEKILADIDELIEDMTGRFRQCGTFECGEANAL